MTTLFETTQLPPAMTRRAGRGRRQGHQGLRRRGQRSLPDAGTAGDGRGLEPLGKAYAAIVGGADPTKTIQSAGKTISKAVAAG